MLNLVFVIVAYIIGTITGRWLYKKSLVGKVMIEFNKLLDEMNRNKK